MSLDLTVTDLFCGAGGSSIGATAAGATLRMAANHWQLAVDTHNANFPDADHDCADITQVDPRRYPSTDILIASPECTNHSQAKSNKHRTDLFNPAGDPAAERSRATMWDVIRFAERHRYQIIVVENVMEVMRWAPIDAWLMAMESYGYRWRIVSLNSMTAHPTPQSRDRWYCVFWLAGNRAPNLEIRPACWCPMCQTQVEGIQTFKRPDRRAGKYRQQYLYRCGRGHVVNPFAFPAAAAIDWSLPCPRIGDRARPLAPATRKRIEVGLERYGPSIVQAAGHTYEAPGSGYYRTWSAGEPMPTQTATAQHGMAVPAWVVSTTRTHAEPRSRPPRPVDQPLGTLPLLMPSGAITRAVTRSPVGAPATVDEPLAPMCTGNHHALVVPLRRRGVAEPAGDGPMPTFCASGGHHALVVRNHGGMDDAASMAKPADRAPFGALTTAGHQSVVALPFTVDYLVNPAIEVDDCGFRMLEPHEIGRAMAFPESYLVEGTKRERVRLYGNAVTPPAMRVLLERCVESLS